MPLNLFELDTFLRRPILCIATFWMAAAPAFAEQTSSAPKGDDVICKFERVMGSNIPKQVCKTRADREVEKREAAEVMREREQAQRTVSRNGSQ